MTILLICTHLAAALALGPIFIGIHWIITRRRSRRALAAFWGRQNRPALDKLGLSGGTEMAPPLKVLEDFVALKTAVEVTMFAHDHGALKCLLDNPGTTPAQLAKFLGFSERPVSAALEVLRAAEVVERCGDGFALTEPARIYLFSDSPLCRNPSARSPVGRTVLKRLRTGIINSAVAHWAKGKSHRAEGWAAAMHQISFPLGFALHRIGALAGARRVLDVAGGAGSVCIALALEDSSKELTVLELPGSTATVRRMTRAYGVEDRVQCIDADMFKSEWPSGYDAILFTNVFHDWDDERCRLLVAKAFASLSPGGVIILNEALLNEDQPGPLWTAHYSMAMAVSMRGRQFRASELDAMLRAGGFVETRKRELLGYYSAFVAVRPASAHAPLEHRAA